MAEPKVESPTSDWMEVARQTLRHHRQRLTRPRLAVMEVLNRAEQPLKAEEIRKRAGLAETDLVTVYRNLEAMRARHLIQGIVLEDGAQLFEAVRPGRHFHHVVCRCCHRAEPLETCTGHELEAEAARLGFGEISHVIEVFGVCGQCRHEQGGHAD